MTSDTKKLIRQLFHKNKGYQLVGKTLTFYYDDELEKYVVVKVYDDDDTYDEEEFDDIDEAIDLFSDWWKSDRIFQTDEEASQDVAVQEQEH